MQTTVMSPSNVSTTRNEAAPTNPPAAKQQQQQEGNSSNTSNSNSSSSSMSKMGRKGDPRMHRAVAARLEYPDMALLDALRQGGFIFPADACGHDSALMDADNVTLGQRKNQLSRRLRLARQQQENCGGSVSGSSSTAKHRQPSSFGSDMVSSVYVAGHVNKTTIDLSEQQHQPQSQAAARKRFRTSFTDPATGQQIDDDVDMGDDTQNMDRLAKFHPNFHPIYPAVHQTNAPRLAPSSGIAVASLVSTASAVGLTLEQLAMRLSDTPTLFQTLSNNPDPQTKVQLAVNLFKTDSRALLQKCMLHAGFGADEVVEGNSSYMQVALKAWEVEGKRLEILLGCDTNDGNGEPMQRNGAFCECLPGVGAANATAITMANLKNDIKAVAAPASHQYSHTHDHSHDDTCRDLQGRHVHRLSGKCGHKAIIHQPKGRPAHIDFVVDGKIECYEGIQPVGPKGQGALWPSGYKCIDLACPTDSSGQSVACGSNVGNSNDGSAVSTSAADNVPSYAPKQLSLNDVDFDGKEWNVDFFSHDGQDDTLLGLMKLSDGEKEKEITELPTV